jgi:multidrug resistance efflux pump
MPDTKLTPEQIAEAMRICDLAVQPYQFSSYEYSNEQIDLLRDALRSEHARAEAALADLAEMTRAAEQFRDAAQSEGELTENMRRQRNDAYERCAKIVNKGVNNFFDRENVMAAIRTLKPDAASAPPAAPPSPSSPARDTKTDA